MYIDEKIRNKAYFLIDKFKGGSVSKKISELELFEQYDDNFKKKIINTKLSELLKDITSNVPFYSKYNAANHLNDLPIIDKKNIIKNKLDFLSKKFNKKSLVSVHTSGSYGTPLTYYLTPDKKKRQLAEVIYYGRKSGYDVGVRHGYFRSEAHKSKHKFWLQNEVFFASKRLNNEFVEKGIDNLKKKKLKSLIGFPSAIAFLAQGCIDNGYQSEDFNVVGVITSAENLTIQQRNIIKKAFNCPIHSRYSTEELGVLGQQYDGDSPFEFNTCNYIFEVLKLDRDESVEIGEIGRIIVTDLHSNSMPLIRYETGDLGVLNETYYKSSHWAKSIKTLSGRTMEIIFSTKDEALYPLYFDTIMDKYNIFSQYQIIQIDKSKYTLKLVTNEKFVGKDFDVNLFIERFHEWLGNDADIKIEYVDDIEKLPSGKRPYIINKYKQYSN